jgi:hypothetical protein
MRLGEGRLSVTVRDRGYARFIKRIEELERPSSVKVGVFGEKANASAGDGVTVGEVAVYNEFGTQHIPPRPFVSGWIDENQSALNRMLDGMAREILLGRGDSTEESLKRLGEHVKNGIIARIQAGISPSNAESTVMRKGHNLPLVDTGRLKDSIDYEVEK